MSEEVRLEKRQSERTAYFHSLTDKPEDAAWIQAESWAQKKGLLEKTSKTRIFGRNTYPTKNPEPHGYGYYLTIPPDLEVEDNIIIRTIPEGLYAVLRCEGLAHITERWSELWKWLNESKSAHIGETKGEYGYELGFEEHLNWYEVMVECSANNFLFDLMLQLKEE